MPFTLQNRKFLHSDFFKKLFGQEDIQLVRISKSHCALHKGLTSVICCENENKILLTRIFSTRVKGVSKARTKMVAAQREIRSPPVKYITTLNMVIWTVDAHCIGGSSSCWSYIVWVGQDGESEHADDLHVDEVAAVGESGEGGEDGPG